MTGRLGIITSGGVWRGIPSGSRSNRNSHVHGSAQHLLPDPAVIRPLLLHETDETSTLTMYATDETGILMTVEISGIDTKIVGIGGIDTPTTTDETVTMIGVDIEIAHEIVIQAGNDIRI